MFPVSFEVSYEIKSRLKVKISSCFPSRLWDFYALKIVTINLLLFKIEVLQLLIIPGEPVNHAKAYGRIAFSCPFDEQPTIDETIQAANETILTPLISLDTPGKATVRVIILADPDGHEICFVDDESFRQLSQVDPTSDADLDKFIKADKSRA